MEVNRSRKVLYGSFLLKVTRKMIPATRNSKFYSQLHHLPHGIDLPKILYRVQKTYPFQKFCFLKKITILKSFLHFLSTLIDYKTLNNKVITGTKETVGEVNHHQPLNDERGWPLLAFSVKVECRAE